MDTHPANLIHLKPTRLPDVHGLDLGAGHLHGLWLEGLQLGGVWEDVPEAEGLVGGGANDGLSIGALSHRDDPVTVRIGGKVPLSVSLELGDLDEGRVLPHA